MHDSVVVGFVIENDRDDTAIAWRPVEGRSDDRNRAVRMLGESSGDCPEQFAARSLGARRANANHHRMA
jgi:hypothetical protein